MIRVVGVWLLLFLPRRPVANLQFIEPPRKTQVTSLNESGGQASGSERKHANECRHNRQETRAAVTDESFRCEESVVNKRLFRKNPRRERKKTDGQEQTSISLENARS